MTMSYAAVGLAVLIVIAWLGYRLVEYRANLRFERWKAEHSRAISREAIKGSQAAVSGRVFERVAPYLPGFAFHPRDVRFIGDPVDFVVFDGLAEGNLRKVVFVEVKTGAGDLNGNERRVKSTIAGGRVEWLMYRVPEDHAALRGHGTPPSHLTRR
jgi:predicted Holliday junction resolvase-like endonuclease